MVTIITTGGNMNNTQQSKQYLLSSIRNLPADNSLGEARFLLKKALNEIERVESKRDRRQKNQNTIEVSNIVNPFTAKQSLNQIEQMIKAEEEKLNKKTTNTDVNTMFD